MTAFGKRPCKPDLPAYARAREEVSRDQPKPRIQPCAPDGSEHRKGRRKRALKGAYISYNDRHFTIPCMVRDVSELGARLRIDDRSIAPDTFILHIELDSVEVDCEVVWRSKNEVGIKFVSEIKSVKPSRIQVVSSTDQTPASSIKRHPIRG